LSSADWIIVVSQSKDVGVEVDENELASLISFVQGLQAARVAHSLSCSRDAIMVTIPGPGRYLEAEFFADGHVEVQSFGPPSSEVVTTSPDELFRIVVDSVDTGEGPDPLDTLFGK
jgi:hypothetical protein